MDERRMRGIVRRCGWVALVVVFFALPVFGGTVPKPKKKGPKIFIPQPTFEAGKVVEGDSVTHTFLVKNQGNQDLIIKSVKPG